MAQERIWIQWSVRLCENVSSPRLLPSIKFLLNLTTTLLQKVKLPSVDCNLLPAFPNQSMLEAGVLMISPPIGHHKQ